jgi:hypothetical protein
VNNVLMNLLPGLRDLRAPLAAGYLWLITLWLALDRLGWLPAKRPAGTGEVAQLWSLGGTLGKTVLLAALTFLAYLVGSFLEMDPEGRMVARYLSNISFTRMPWYADYINGVVEDYRPWSMSKPDSLRSALAVSSVAGMRVAHSISQEARWDLLKLFQQRNAISTHTYDSELTELVSKSENKSTYIPDGPLFSQLSDAPQVTDLILSEESDASAKWRAKQYKRHGSMGGVSIPYAIRIAYAEADGDKIIVAIIDEMTQLASRLLVKNNDLYARYDKFMAEASLRINVSLPLASLLIVATLLSGIPLWLKPVLVILALAFGFLLCRQGVLRAVSARDVIAQALIIDEIQSRNIPPETPSADQADEQSPSVVTAANVADGQSTDEKTSAN